MIQKKHLGPGFVFEITPGGSRLKEKISRLGVLLFWGVPRFEIMPGVLVLVFVAFMPVGLFLLNSHLWALVLLLLKSRLGVIVFSFCASRLGVISKSNTGAPKHDLKKKHQGPEA